MPATDAAVQALLVPQDSLPENEQSAYELATRQALEIVVVRHLLRQRPAAGPAMPFARSEWAGM